MKHLINEAVIEMINNGLLHFGRIGSLIYIKEFIDRISSASYIDDETVKMLKDKYGVIPNIITWGDYFQTEIASSTLKASDFEFEKAVATVRFDMIASHYIFFEKEQSFFEWVSASFEDLSGLDYEALNEEEKEIVHLHCLMNYYKNLGIEDRFSETEMKWFNLYSEAVAV